MEVELARHNWPRLKSLRDSSALPEAIRALVDAKSVEVAEAAYWRIDNVAVVDGCLTQSAGPVASCVVQSLSLLSAPALTCALELLSQISGGYVHESPNENLGPITVEECVVEISLAFPFYCEVLESSQDERARAASIDLIMMCGLYVRTLRQRAKYVLESVLIFPDIGKLKRLIVNSLNDLESGL